MHDQVVDAAIAEPKKRKVRKLAVALHVGNSVVECFARSKRTWAGSADARPYRRF